ncbi:unnamed protein product, partial [Aphanomyces euteiches]
MLAVENSEPGTSQSSLLASTRRSPAIIDLLGADEEKEMDSFADDDDDEIPSCAELPNYRGKRTPERMP